ncbi:MAG: hypothetical protein FJ189_14450, partial [Gammaproteobacteria bacterium]|nr:hypothetical protein [Gammaproteobacteria bacterium]
MKRPVTLGLSKGLKSLLPQRQTILVRLLVWTGGLTGLILVVVIGWNYFAMLGRLDQEAQHRAASLAEASADK